MSVLIDFVGFSSTSLMNFGILMVSYWWQYCLLHETWQPSVSSSHQRQMTANFKNVTISQSKCSSVIEPMSSLALLFIFTDKSGFWYVSMQQKKISNYYSQCGILPIMCCLKYLPCPVCTVCFSVSIYRYCIHTLLLNGCSMFKHNYFFF